MYKPCTVAQFKALEYLRGSFDTSLCLIYPTGPDGLVLEDMHGGKLAFSWLDGRIKEQPVPEPGSVDDLRLFVDTLTYCCPEPSQWTFEMRHKLWMEGAFQVTYQQALGLSDELFRYYLSHPMITAEDIQGLVVQGTMKEDAFYSLVLWLQDGHTRECTLIGPIEDSAGIHASLFFDDPRHDVEMLQFYLVD